MVSEDKSIGFVYQQLHQHFSLELPSFRAPQLLAMGVRRQGLLHEFASLAMEQLEATSNPHG